MNIDKAIRKQKRSHRILMLSTGLIFFMLPGYFILTGKFYTFYTTYLIILEILIFLAIIVKVDNASLSFTYDGYRLKVNIGIKNSRLNIICDKIVFVHVEDYVQKNTGRSEFKIIFISISKFRNDRMIPVHREFLKRHAYVAHEYAKLKIIYPKEEFYYTIIKRGELNKYPFLDTVYKSCVYANFTKESIEKIKFYRNNSENYVLKNKK
ncbi:MULTISPECIES: hypothetical protein [Clostridium]|jgi:hypothetical protein|uniref:Uncharacterized protein n=1 Tax=Clostridium lapidicellarium TaxID=3240931 RepID=A0ABV4DVE6_9CLOT|nr:hypothetical protein [uncultured Clostridium sp.]